MTSPEILDGLPEAETIVQGLRDLSERRCDSIGALLVAIAARRLRDLGLDVPPDSTLPADPELRLYELLGEQSADAYGRYNALLARLVSFAQALEQRVFDRQRSDHIGDGC